MKNMKSKLSPQSRARLVEVANATWFKPKPAGKGPSRWSVDGVKWYSQEDFIARNILSGGFVEGRN